MNYVQQIEVLRHHPMHRADLSTVPLIDLMTRYVTAKRRENTCVDGDYNECVHIREELEAEIMGRSVEGVSVRSIVEVMA